MFTRPARRAALLLILALTPLAAAGAPLQTPGALRADADRLLEDASTKLAAARRWLETNTSRENLRAVADQLSADLRASWESALSRAESRAALTLGIRRFAPAGTSDWSRLAPSEPLPPSVVILIHGLDEPGDVWNDLAPALDAAGHAVLRFDYPNDQAIADSTAALARELRALRADHAVERIALVGHSMGGLIIRDVLTRPADYAGHASGNPELPTLEHAITIATPNDGSLFAPLRPVAEVRDQFMRYLGSSAEVCPLDPAILLGFLADGRGEAGRDLRPGSAFLDELNARPAWSADVAARVTSLTAEFRPLPERRLDAILGSAAARMILSSAGESNIREAAHALSSALGDGVVSDGSGQFDCTIDTVRLSANHRSIIRRQPWEGDSDPEPPAIGVIIHRLSQPPR